MADGDDLFFPVIVKKGAKIIRPKTFTKCRRGVADLVSRIEDHTRRTLLQRFASWQGGGKRHHRYTSNASKRHPEFRMQIHRNSNEKLRRTAAEKASKCF